MAKQMTRPHDLARKLSDAGLIPGDINDVRRAVLVLDAMEVPVLYVEYYTDERWLDVIAVHEEGIKVVTGSEQPS